MQLTSFYLLSNLNFYVFSEHRQKNTTFQAKEIV